MFEKSRHPHEVLFLIGCLLWGVLGTVAFERAASTSLRMLPEPWGRMFYILMAIGAVVPLWGIVRGGISGAYLERAGLLILTGFNLAYAIGVLAVSGFRGLGFVLFMTCLAVANLVRCWQIPKEIDRLLKAAAAAGAADQLGE